MNGGFIKLKRTAETAELLSDPNAFTLLTVIALRARRTDEFNIHHLEAGEALIGDHERYGLTRQEYRSAQRRLRQWGLAGFKPTTNGTVARLLDQRIYDINPIPAEPTGNQPPTSRQPPNNRQPTISQPPTRMRRMKRRNRSIPPTLTSGDSPSFC